MASPGTFSECGDWVQRSIVEFCSRSAGYICERKHVASPGTYVLECGDWKQRLIEEFCRSSAGNICEESYWLLPGLIFWSAVFKSKRPYE